MTTPPALLTHAETAMGTVFSITVVTGGRLAGELRPALAAACAVLHRADAVFSTWDPGSPVSRLRRGEATLGEVPPEVAEVLAECRAARQASGGWFDPWAMPGGVDPTGLVKGWAVERALAVMNDEGIGAALINGGGDVAAYGAPAAGERWRAGIRHPWRPGALAAVVEVAAAVATSGCYERGPHLIDPATGQPASRAASATVTGPRLALADALATAVAVGGDEALAAVAALEGYEGYLIRPDGSETDTGGVTFVTVLPEWSGLPGNVARGERHTVIFRVAGGTGMPAHGLWLVQENETVSAAPAAARRGSRPQMTVQDEATAQGVILTPTAAAKVSNLLTQEGRDDLKLRIAVQPGGCSGLRYQLYFDERDIEGDVKATYEGVHVVTDKMSAPYLAGATIDFVDTIEKQGFTIDNPNATGSCACGDSFH